MSHVARWSARFAVIVGYLAVLSVVALAGAVNINYGHTPVATPPKSTAALTPAEVMATMPECKTPQSQDCYLIDVHGELWVV